MHLTAFLQKKQAAEKPGSIKPALGMGKGKGKGKVLISMFFLCDHQLICFYIYLS
jgi:hypothetical protein